MNFEEVTLPLKLRRSWLLSCISYERMYQEKLLKSIVDRGVVGYHDPKQWQEIIQREESKDVYNPYFEEDLRKLKAGMG